MKHGGNIYKIAKELTCKPKEIIDFSSNINSYHPKIELQISDEMIVPYADASYKNLKKSISQTYNIKSKNLALYNGASSAIFELLRHLKALHVTLYAPLYSEYESAAKQSNKKIVKINRFEDITKKPKKGSIVIFVNPSTPDGKFYNLDKLFKIWKKRKCSVILDESFLEFETLKSERARIKKYKKLYIVQSFSKFYSCAGVRIGAIFSNEKNIKKLLKPRWNLSSFDVAFLDKRLQDKRFVSKTHSLHVRRKRELFDILKESSHFSKIYPTSSNYFLVQSPKAHQLYLGLLKHKILVRECKNFDFLDESHLRFAIKESHSHKLLQKALHALS